MNIHEKRIVREVSTIIGYDVSKLVGMLVSVGVDSLVFVGLIEEEWDGLCVVVRSSNSMMLRKVHPSQVTPIFPISAP